MHHKFDGLQDQSSSASRVTAGAAGFLILTQQSLRPGRYGDPSALRHYAFAAERAGLLVDDRAVGFEMAVERNAWLRAAQQSLEGGFANLDRSRRKSSPSSSSRSKAQRVTA